METHECLQGKTPKQCFNLFKSNPISQPSEILQGTHKFLLESLKGKLDEPTVDDLIEIFQVFAKDQIKRYLFKSIKKNLNLELALSIVQDLISNGPARAKTLELKVVKLANKGKKVVVRDAFQSPAETPISADDFAGIDEAVFRLTDTSGKSPVRAIAIGRGHAAPSNDARIEKGYLTPHKQPRSSFQIAADRIEVSATLSPIALERVLVLKFQNYESPTKNMQIMHANSCNLNGSLPAKTGVRKHC